MSVILSLFHYFADDEIFVEISAGCYFSVKMTISSLFLWLSQLVQKPLVTTTAKLFICWGKSIN